VRYRGGKEGGVRSTNGLRKLMGFFYGCQPRWSGKGAQAVEKYGELPREEKGRQK